VSFAAITLSVASQRVVYFVIDLVLKLLDKPSYISCSMSDVAPEGMAVNYCSYFSTQTVDRSTFEAANPKCFPFLHYYMLIPEVWY
jgi:hypothetical protein